AELLTTRLRSLIESREVRAARRATLGVEICFLGQRFTINSDKEQILDLLISTFEDTVRANRELHRHRAELAEATAKLEEYATTLEERVAARTAELSRERAFRDLVIENIPGFVVVKDAKTLQYLMMNSYGAKALGIEPEAVVGKLHADLLDQELADRF